MPKQKISYITKIKKGAQITFVYPKESVVDLQQQPKFSQSQKT